MRCIWQLAAVGCLMGVGSAVAQEYNKVPAGDVQFEQCLKRVNRVYEGGSAKSPIAGQNKSQAYCTCLWNETPDDFGGDLSKFADSEKGKKVDRICARYANWE